MKPKKGKLLKAGDVLIMVSKKGGCRYTAIVKVTKNHPNATQPRCSVDILKVLQVEKPLNIIEGISLCSFYEELFFPNECPQEVKQLLNTLEKTCSIGTNRLTTPYDKVFQGNVA